MDSILLLLYFFAIHYGLTVFAAKTFAVKAYNLMVYIVIFAVFVPLPIFLLQSGIISNSTLNEILIIGSLIYFSLLLSKNLRVMSSMFTEH